MKTERQKLNAQDFSIFPVGRKVCFIDKRNGACVEAPNAEELQRMLAEYIKQHRGPAATMD